MTFCHIYNFPNLLHDNFHLQDFQSLWDPWSSLNFKTSLPHDQIMVVHMSCSFFDTTQVTTL